MTRRHWLVLAVYAGFALLALYRPFFWHETHVTGQPVTDFYHFHWNYGWMRHALANGLPIYETNYVFAPATSSLAYHTLTPFWFPLWALLEPLAGTSFAMTSIMFTSMTLAGFVFYLLLRREGVSSGLALVGGLLLQLCPLMFNGAHWTNINLMGWFWLPALVLLWGRVALAGSLRAAVAWTLMTGVGLWGMVLVDLQYPLFALFILLPYGLLTLWQSARRVRLIALGLIAVALGATLLWVAGPLPHILDYDRSNLSPTPVERAVSIDWPLGFIWHIDGEAAPVSYGALVLPLTLIALIVGRRTRNRRRWFWLALVPLPLILSAGGSITIGNVTIPLPYIWLHELFGGMFRYPERFAPVALIPAVTFALMSLTPLLRGRVLLLSGLILLIAADARLFESVAIQPQPTQHAVYEAMGRDGRDYVVIEVPTGASSGEGIVGQPDYATTQFYGLTHSKRMVNGHLSRVNINHYWYLRTDDPLLSWLGGRRLLEPETAEAHLREIIYDYPVGYIIVHTDKIARDTGPSTVVEVVGWLNAQRDLLCPVSVEGDMVAYRTSWHPAGCPPRTPPEIEPGIHQIDIGIPESDRRFIGWGWHYPETVGGLSVRWAGRFAQTQLYLDLPPDAYTVTLTAQAFTGPRMVEIRINDVSIGSAMIDALTDVTFALPSDVVGHGHNLTLTLTYDVASTPAELGLSDDDRPLALMVDRVRFIRQD